MVIGFCLWITVRTLFLIFRFPVGCQRGTFVFWWVRVYRVVMRFCSGLSLRSYEEFAAEVCEDQSEKKGKIGLDQDENSQVRVL